MKSQLSKRVKLDAIFFKTGAGNEPVREWLKELSKEDKKRIGSDIQTVQFGWPLGMPLIDNLGQGIWEIRTHLTSNRIARILFLMDKNSIVLLNGFIKKTKKKSLLELELSRKRLRQYIDGHPKKSEGTMS